MFLNPMMLAGLGGAAVPLALHLLSRAQFRPVDWGAMMFLEHEQLNELRSARVKRWILLALRMAAIGLLAVALARPVIQARAGAVRPVMAAIIIDCSGSMGYDEGGRTRIDQARGVVLQILSRFKRGDQAALLITGAGVDANRQPLQPTGDFEALAARVADLDAGRDAANLADSLTSAMNLLDRGDIAGSATRRELYVVCDRQAASWGGITDSFISAWRGRNAKSARLDRFAVLPVGSDACANVAVAGAEPICLPVIAGIANRFEVTLKNYGPQPRQSVSVNLTAVGSEQPRELFASTVNLPPRASASLSGDVVFSKPGPQLVSATIKSRGITADDRLDAVVDVREPIRVLVVSFNAGQSAAGADGAQLAAAALAPYKAAQRRGIDPAQVQVTAASALPTANLTDYQVVVLADVSNLDATTAQKLQRFVSGGGGLLISVGLPARADSINAALFPEGAGLLPAELGAANPEPLDAALQIDLPDHPAVRAIAAAGADATIGAIKQSIAATPAPGARVLVRTASDQPLLIERTVGRGKVILLTASLGSETGNLPGTALYVPLLQSIVSYLATSGMDQHNLLVGDEIVATLPRPPAGAVTVTLPDGAIGHCDVVSLNDRTQARFGQTRQTGIYRMHVGPVAIPFVVRASLEESDLTPLTEQNWRRLSQALGLEQVDRPEDALPTVAAVTGQSLWMPIVLTVIGVLVVELALTRWWSR